MAFQPLSYRLLEASELGDISLMKKLFTNKVKAEITDNHGNTPLMLAVKHNHVCAAKMLIGYGSNIEHANNQLHRAVHLATMNGNAEILVLLLSRGARFDVQNHEGFSPIQLTHSDSAIHKILFSAQKGMSFNEYEQINDVPVIPLYSIPTPKAKPDKGKKKNSKKGGGGKKKGKKKKK